MGSELLSQKKKKKTAEKLLLLSYDQPVLNK